MTKFPPEKGAHGSYHANTVKVFVDTREAGLTICLLFVSELRLAWNRVKSFTAAATSDTNPSLKLRSSTPIPISFLL